MTPFDEVKCSIKKCLENLSIKDGNLTPLEFSEIINEKLFRDSNFFEVTYLEGLKIRAYLNESIFGRFGKTPYDFVIKLKKEFPEYFSKDDEISIRKINRLRKASGFDEI
ncbi:hypothetical protein COU58_03410 [Candidatus Pacearchaeota archaeon CG10_big_fil_rev_8_21_14_0_10_32_42]|nr:MAG: hypothetical protein COU58_03410 [Candidatus Pacearchaeota archaeon CG10_big_fil_rev_8_21_14_0_10_32_42]